jgi:endo-alpha-1,4-polygalactosaminidase (GH114 family)
MQLTRSQEKRIRAVLSRVHERRLAESLARVEEALRAWHAGEGTVFAVDDAIHQHQMRSRRYWHLYANTAVTSPEVGFILDEALQLGLISSEQHRALKAIWNRPRRPGS